MKKSKNLTKFIIIAVAAWVVVTVLCGMNISAAADETAIAASPGDEAVGQLKELEASTQAMKAANASSEAVIELKAGDYIFVTGETDGWYEIYYRDEILYVDSSVPMKDIDYSDEISAELTGMSATDTAWINEYQMQLRSIKTARTWRIVIAILVVAFIAVTVVSTLKNKKNAKEE